MIAQQASLILWNP